MNSFLDDFVKEQINIVYIFVKKDTLTINIKEI
jgi:hypothetical protein